MKKKYGFYSIIDKNAEIIGFSNFENKQQAIDFFAARKQMNVKSFLKVFYIIEING